MQVDEGAPDEQPEVVHPQDAVSLARIVGQHVQQLGACGHHCIGGRLVDEALSRPLHGYLGRMGVQGRHSVDDGRTRRDSLLCGRILQLLDPCGNLGQLLKAASLRIDGRVLPLDRLRVGLAVRLAL
nr:hypothetical protein [Adlercreutzia caecimuris]